MTDAAGNTSDPSGVVTVKIDTTGPTIGAKIDPNPVLLNGDAQVTPDATDTVSGVVSQSCDALDTSSVGVHTVSCTATNGAGLTTTADVVYRVIYRFDGFIQPINDTGHALTCGSPCPASTFKGGSTIPVKFALTDANGVSVQPAVAPLWVTPRKGAATNSAVDEQDVSEPATTDATYQLRGDHFGYNWSTKGLRDRLLLADRRDPRRRPDLLREHRPPLGGGGRGRPAERGRPQAARTTTATSDSSRVRPVRCHQLDSRRTAKRDR